MGQRTSLEMSNPQKFQGIWYEIARYGTSPYPDFRLKYEFIYKHEHACVVTDKYIINIFVLDQCPSAEPYQQVSTIIDNKLTIGSLEYIILFTDYVNWAFLSTLNNDRMLILGRRSSITPLDRALILAAADKLGFSSSSLLTFPDIIINHGVEAPDPIKYIKI